MTDTRNGGGKPQVRLYADGSYFKTLRQDEADRVLAGLTDEEAAVLNSGMTVELSSRHSVRLKR